MPKLNYEKASELLKALAHPVRLKIIEGLLKGNECNVKKIVIILKLPQSTISQHLRILKNQGIISYRKEGVKSCYRIIDKRIPQIIELLQK